MGKILSTETIKDISAMMDSKIPFSEEELERDFQTGGYSFRELFDLYLRYNGIIGFTDRIIQVYRELHLLKSPE